MFDSFKNAFLASLGLVAMTQEKLRCFVDDLVKRGELTAEQGKKILDEFLQKGQSEGRALSEKIAEEVVKVLQKTPFVSRRELERIEERLRAVETHVGLDAGGAGSATAPSSTMASSDGATGGEDAADV